MADPLVIEGPIARLQLRGGLNADSVALLASAAERIADSEARVVLLTGDSDTWAGWTPAAAASAAVDGLVGDPFGPFATVPQPTAALLEGDVLDAGLELALCADLRIAGEGARFGLPAIAAGRFPIAGGLQRLARAVGRSRATQLAIGGGSIDAPTALTWGLVSEVSADPAAAAQAQAERIAERGPIATRLAKEAVQRGAEMPLDQALRFETDLTILLQTTADREEGVRAFVEKRTPRFRGA